MAPPAARRPSRAGRASAPGAPGAPALPRAEAWRGLVERALAEDLGSGDVTTPLVIGPDLEGAARIEARQPLRVCGLGVAAEVFRRVDPAIRLDAARDGLDAAPGSVLARLVGPLGAILAAERTALNFLQRLSGIATWTSRFVEAVAGTGAAIVDTRKTLPGWRVLDKYAVATGGGINHRVGLYDGILLKDNHVAVAGGVAAAVKAALAAAPAHLRVAVEVESEHEAQRAVEAGCDFLLLDNMGVDAVRRVVEQLGDRALLECSGGVTLENVRDYAETGVHRISIGALTHSAPAVDVSLEVRPGGVEA
jgi:nicotinate-nucleotide pyrophosphorylase (carboxylating)